MLNEKVQNALNEQINAELYSGYLYLSMAAHLAAANLPGMARWMRAQAQEEYEHGMKLYDYVEARGGRVVLSAIAAPPQAYGAPYEIFRQVLAHEQEVTASIHRLYHLAAAEKDTATEIMLQWFVTEQVEEEEHAGAIVAQMEMIGDHPASILLVDRQLGARGG